MDNTGRWWKIPLLIGLCAWAAAGMIFAVAGLIEGIAMAVIAGRVPRWP